MLVFIRSQREGTESFELQIWQCVLATSPKASTSPLYKVLNIATFWTNFNNQSSSKKWSWFWIQGNGSCWLTVVFPLSIPPPPPTCSTQSAPVPGFKRQNFFPTDTFPLELPSIMGRTATAMVNNEKKRQSIITPKGEFKWYLKETECIFSQRFEPNCLLQSNTQLVQDRRTNRASNGCPSLKLNSEFTTEHGPFAPRRHTRIPTILCFFTSSKRPHLPTQVTHCLLHFG